MSDDEALEADQINAKIAKLPPHKQEDAILALVLAALPDLPVDKVREMADEMRAKLAEDQPVVIHTLEMIEGHLALREMGELG